MDPEVAVVEDPRDRYIARVVAGKSFLDVGGLWGVVNEKISVAHAAGASSLAMLDICVPEHELWTAFEARRTQLGVGEVRCLARDVQALAPDFPRFDVVHCSGVLYHVPDPFRLLAALHRITRHYLVLTTVVTGERVECAAGALTVPAAAAIFVPALADAEREILRGYWTAFVGDAAWGLTREVEAWGARDYVPWWWLPTRHAVERMCEAAGFRTEARASMWNDNAYTLLLRTAED